MNFPLKTIFFSGLVTIAAFVMIVSQSCNADKCKSLICANHGVCNMGVCICPAGFDGTNCEDTARNKFGGNWMVFEKGSATFANQYPITIVPGDLITDILIYNFYDSIKHPILATVSGTTLTIPNQRYEGKIILGKGYIYTPSNVNYNQYSAMSVQYEIIDSATGHINDFGYDALDDGSAPSAWNK